MANRTEVQQLSRPDLMVWLVLLALGLIWGSSFLTTKVALTGLSPLWLAATRITIGAVVLLIASYLFGQGLPSTRSQEGRRIWVFALGFALFSNAAPFALLAWAQVHVTSAFAGVTMALVPLAILPLSHFLVPGERLGPRRLIGFLIGFAGAIVLIGPQNIDLTGGDTITFIARLACLAATCCYAIGAVIARLAPPGPQLSFTAAGLAIGAVLSIGIAGLAEGIPPAPQISAAISVVYLGLLPTGLAAIMLVFLVRRAGPPFLSLVNYQVPVWAVLFGMLVLGEALPGSFFAALALILFGIGVSQLRYWRPR